MVGLKMIEEANDLVKNSVKRTPIVECPLLSDMAKNSVFFKLENLQNTGSFKVRGALNKLANLTKEEKSYGVVAASAGNHAQGVARGAKEMGIKATIVMPEATPISKVLATKSYGAEVVLYGDSFDSALKKAREIEREKHMTFLHPFDDEFVIAGQGTIGIEILEEIKDVDVILAPIGGGGILAGIATAAKSINPNIKVIGVEAEEAASMTEALKKNCCVEIESCKTIADGIAVKKVGEKTYELIKKYVDEIITVSEMEIAKAIVFLLEKSKIVAEGAGATSVAALLAGKLKSEGKKVCAVISGGNIDISQLERMTNKVQIFDGRRCELKFHVEDKSGEIEKILKVLADNKANIVYVNQTKYNSYLKINEQEFLVVFQCINKEHREIILKELNKHNFNIINNYIEKGE